MIGMAVKRMADRHSGIGNITGSNIGSDCFNSKSLSHILNTTDTKVKLHLILPVRTDDLSRVLEYANAEEH